MEEEHKIVKLEMSHHTWLSAIAEITTYCSFQKWNILIKITQKLQNLFFFFLPPSFPLSFLCKKAVPESHGYHQQAILYHLDFISFSAKLFHSPLVRWTLKPKQKPVTLRNYNCINQYINNNGQLNITIIK